MLQIAGESGAHLQDKTPEYPLLWYLFINHNYHRLRDGRSEGRSSKRQGRKLIRFNFVDQISEQPVLFLVAPHF